MTKMTYVKALDRVINGGEVTPEVIDKLEALRATLAKKATAERKPTAKQTANAETRAALVAGEISKGSVKRRTYFAPIGTYETEEGA